MNIARRHLNRVVHCAVALLFALPLSLPATALSQSADPGSFEEDKIARVEELSQKGTELFAAGRFMEAIAVFKQANAITPVGTLLYNIALCYDKMADSENARNFYEKFILAPDADANIRVRALARIKEIDREAQLKVVTPPDKTETTPPPIEVKERSKEGLGGMATAGIFTGISGLALLGGGGIFGSLALADKDKFDNTTTLAQKQQARDDASRNALLADMLFGAGGLAIATGVLLFALDDGVEEDRASIRWTPWVGPSTVGATVEMPFGNP